MFFVPLYNPLPIHSPRVGFVFDAQRHHMGQREQIHAHRSQRCTHPVPEHIGLVPPTVLVMLLAAAIRNHFLIEGLVPVGRPYDTAALPLRNTNTRHNFVRALFEVYRES